MGCPCEVTTTRIDTSCDARKMKVPKPLNSPSTTDLVEVHDLGCVRVNPLFIRSHVGTGCLGKVCTDFFYVLTHGTVGRWCTRICERIFARTILRGVEPSEHPRQNPREHLRDNPARHAHKSAKKSLPRANPNPWLAPFTSDN